MVFKITTFQSIYHYNLNVCDCFFFLIFSYFFITIVIVVVVMQQLWLLLVSMLTLIRLPSNEVSVHHEYAVVAMLTHVIVVGKKRVVLVYKMYKKNEKQNSKT